jgi:hypothetical protein
VEELVVLSTGVRAWAGLSLWTGSCWESDLPLPKLAELR